MSNTNDFIIENGVLTKYIGPGGDVVIPDGVTAIGKGAFSRKKKLTSVTIPASVTKIGSTAFSGCDSLARVTLPEGITEIGNNGFYGCSSLTDVTLPEGVTSIRKQTFFACSSLAHITIPESVTAIGEQAFAECKSLRSVIIPKGVKRIKWGTFLSCSSLENVVIPDSVTTIEDWSFRYCSALKSVVIPEGVTSIGDGVFYGCRLEKLVLPGSVASFGNAFIPEHSEKTDISIPDISRLPAPLRINALRCFVKDGAPKDDPRFASHCKYIKTNAAKLVWQAINDKTLLSLMCAEKLITPKNAPLYVDAAQKTGNAEAIAMMLDYQANKIGAKQKESLEKRKEKEQDTITERMIARQGKADVKGLNIAVTGKLETFENRNELKSFLTKKGAKLASGLTAKVDYLIMNDSESDSAKAQKAQELGIEILTEREFNERIDRVFVIEEQELKAYCGNGGDVTIPAGVTSIGNRAFSNCSSLTSVTIPDGVTSIGIGAFSGCSSLTSVTIPEGVTSIRDYAFYGCSSLASVEIPDGVTSIGDSAFYGCSSLVNVTIPGSVTSIEWGAFLHCSSLKSVAIPDGVTSIESGVFSDCSSLKHVEIPDGVTSIGNTWRFRTA